MAGRALDVARIQRVVNTCWLSESLGQLPASGEGRERRGERGKERQREGGRECVPSQRSNIPSVGN